MSGGELRQIGPFEILDTIAYGGMAAVYRAYQPSLDRTVALKVISPALAADPEFMERFRQEALAAARLSHPNILVVHDFGIDRGQPFIVMQYVNGSTLASLIHDGLDGPRMADVLDQLAAGLDYAHARKIVHRDVKPQNVLVDEDGRAVLADFGLARLMEGTQRLTMVGGVVGTPEYMSPEQAAGHRVDHRTDLYALGIILYEVLAGERPFTAETPLGVLMKHLQEPPSLARLTLHGAPSAVQPVLERALAKDPDQRFQSAGELARAFRAAIGSIRASAAAIRSVEAPVHDTRVPPEPVAPAPAATPLLAAGAQPTPSLPRPPKPAVCPECQAALAENSSMCPRCTFLLPFASPCPSERSTPVRKQLRINLLPYNLRWDPSGLDAARRLALEAVYPLVAEGWELLTPVEGAGVFVQGRSVAGPVVQSAVLTLQGEPEREALRL